MELAEAVSAVELLESVSESLPDDAAVSLEEVDEAVGELPVEVCARASAVALRVPHCSFSVHCAWASASFGLLAIHWTNVC